MINRCDQTTHSKKSSNATVDLFSNVVKYGGRCAHPAPQAPHPGAALRCRVGSRGLAPGCRLKFYRLKGLSTSRARRRERFHLNDSTETMLFPETWWIRSARRAPGGQTQNSTPPLLLEVVKEQLQCFCRSLDLGADGRSKAELNLPGEAVVKVDPRYTS